MTVREEIITGLAGLFDGMPIDLASELLASDPEATLGEKLEALSRVTGASVADLIDELDPHRRAER